MQQAPLPPRMAAVDSSSHEPGDDKPRRANFMKCASFVNSCSTAIRRSETPSAPSGSTSVAPQGLDCSSCTDRQDVKRHGTNLCLADVLACRKPTSIVLCGILVSLDMILCCSVTCYSVTCCTVTCCSVTVRMPLPFSHAGLMTEVPSCSEDDASRREANHNDVLQLPLPEDLSSLPNGIEAAPCMQQAVKEICFNRRAVRIAPCH